MLDELSELNGEYRKKNGFVFLVCASGLPADAVLASLKARLPNDRDTEVRFRFESGGSFKRLLLCSPVPAGAWFTQAVLFRMARAVMGRAGKVWVRMQHGGWGRAKDIAESWSLR